MWFWGTVLLTLVALAVAVPLRAGARDDRPWSVAEHALIVAALAWAAGVTIYLASVPIYEGVESMPEAGTPAERIATAHRTLLQVNGPGVLVAMLIPVVLTALPLLRFTPAKRRRLEVINAMLLLVFVVVGALSIGLLYAPSAMALLIAAALAMAGSRDPL